MDLLSAEEMLEQLDIIIRTLEANEDVYFIALDLAHQAREEIASVSFDEDDND